MSNDTCMLPECDKPARSKAVSLCKMHYHRQYRHGSTDMVSSKSGVTASHGRRYRTTHVKGHALAGADGKVYVHRLVLFNTIGPGEHACHWCNVTVSWDKRRGEDGALNVDHINSIGDDNRAENLVPCCVSCNNARSQQRRSDALRNAGWWTSNDTVARLNDPTQRRLQRVA